ncbi:MAG: ribonuclease III [Phycisphaerales bacterium]
MSDEVRDRAERSLGYTFRNADLLALALRHASVSDDPLQSNERMEFLGDSVLGLIVSHRLYERFPALLEGELTKIKSAAVSRQTCALIARSLGLEELLVLGKGMQGANGPMPQSLAAAVFESLIAAVYLDAGYERARSFVLPLIDPLLERAASSGHQENFKSVLQQHAQQTGQGTPLYRVLDEKGPDHSKCFKVCVELGGKKFPPTWGQAKKQAEQAAALAALRELGLVVETGDGHLRVVGTPESAA